MGLFFIFLYVEISCGFFTDYTGLPERNGKIYSDIDFGIVIVEL